MFSYINEELLRQRIVFSDTNITWNDNHVFSTLFLNLYDSFIFITNRFTSVIQVHHCLIYNTFIIIYDRLNITFSITYFLIYLFLVFRIIFVNEVRTYESTYKVFNNVFVFQIKFKYPQRSQYLLREESIIFCTYTLGHFNHDS